MKPDSVTLIFLSIFYEKFDVFKLYMINKLKSVPDIRKIRSTLFDGFAS